jgi:hypothetical protein
MERVREDEVLKEKIYGKLPGRIGIAWRVSAPTGRALSPFSLLSKKDSGNRE